KVRCPTCLGEIPSSRCCACRALPYTLPRSPGKSSQSDSAQRSARLLLTAAEARSVRPHDKHAGTDRQSPSLLSRRGRRRPTSRPPSCRGRRSVGGAPESPNRDRKSTRLNSSHLVISYAVFCLKKKKTK